MSIFENEAATIKGSKIFIKDKMIIGVAGYPRIHDILEYSLELPPDNETDPLKYIINDFMDAFMDILDEKGSLEIVDGVQNMPGSYIMVGYRGHILQIANNFQIEEYKENYTAIGSGSQVAIGALCATENSKISSVDRIQIALEASSRFCNGVREPFNILELKYGGSA